MVYREDFYRPEEALRRLAVEAAIHPSLALRCMGKIYRLIQSIIASPGAEQEDHEVLGGRLAIALLEEFGTDNPLIGRMGTEEVLRRITFATRLIGTEVQYLVQDAVPDDLLSEVSFHNDVSITTDPSILLSFIIARDRDDPHDHQIHQRQLRSKHARAMLTLGIVGFLLEVADEQGWIESDLRELSGAVTYTSPMRNVTVVTHTSRHRKEPGTMRIERGSSRVFLSEEEGDLMQYLAALRGRKKRFYKAEFLCREATVGGVVYYVYTNARPKGLLSKILKTVRARRNWKKFLRDSRGVKDVVVAVRDHDGQLRAANRLDADDWGDFVKSCVYALPGVHEERLEKKQQGAMHGGPEYWDRKIYGRIVRKHGRYRVGGLFEWIVQPVEDHLHALVHASPDHHDIYVMKRFWLDFLPAVFSHRPWGEDGSLEYTRAFRRWMRIVSARRARDR